MSPVRHNDVIYASVSTISKVVAVTVANCGQVGQEQPATTDNDKWHMRQEQQLNYNIILLLLRQIKVSNDLKLLVVVDQDTRQCEPKDRTHVRTQALKWPLQAKGHVLENGN